MILLIVDLTREQQIVNYIRHHTTGNMKIMKIIKYYKAVNNNWSLKPECKYDYRLE